METFILMMFVSYSTAKDDLPGGAAITQGKEFFTSRQNCEDEAEEARKRLAARFNRVVVWCMHRREPGEDILPKPTLKANPKAKG